MDPILVRSEAIVKIVNECVHDYATKEYVDDAVSAATGTDLSAYAKKTDLNDYLTTSDAESTYAKKTDLDDYLTTSDASSTYATKDYVDAGYAKKTDLNNYLTTSDASTTYATKEYVDNAVSGTTGSDLSNYATLTGKETLTNKTLKNPILKDNTTDYQLTVPTLTKNTTIASTDYVADQISDYSIAENATGINTGSVNTYSDGKISGTLTVDELPALALRCYHVSFTARTASAISAGDIINLTNIHASTHSEMGYIMIDTPFYQMRLQPYTTGGIVLEAKKDMVANFDISAEGLFMTYNNYPFFWSST